MASMRDIKRRKSSISSTQQITKAMKLVSTVKLQKAKTHAEATTPYFDSMYKTVCSMLAKAGTVNHPYLQKQKSTKKAIIVISSNRGLAGGYNSNVIKLITGGDFEKEDLLIYAIGHKDDASRICEELLKKYVAGEIGEIYLAYTHFKNTVVHVPTLMKLLPVELDKQELEASKEATLLMNFEPNEEAALEMIVPKYVTSLLYGALIEAVASENGARMQAMDSATSNAEDMIDDLTLKYNRARQGSITQELTEIIAGAEAIS